MNKRLEEYLVEKGLFITAIFSIIVILLIIAFVFREGFPIFQQYGFLNFIFGMDWSPSNGQYGVFTMIIGTLSITVLALIMAVPLSILCAIFMAEIAPNTYEKNFKTCY